MSRAYDDAMDERREAAMSRYVAGELHVTEAVLARHPYDLTQLASNDGLVYAWEIRWDNTAPPGVDGSDGFTQIPPDHSVGTIVDWPDDI